MSTAMFIKHSYIQIHEFYCLKSLLPQDLLIIYFSFQKQTCQKKMKK